MDNPSSNPNINHNENRPEVRKWLTGCRPLAIAAGGLALAVTGIFWSLYGITAARDETRDEYDAGVATAQDNLPTDIASVDGSHGRATIMIVQGDAVKCYIDNVGFDITRTRHGYVSDVGAYTITVVNSKERGGMQMAVFENRAELVQILGPDPCNPPVDGPKASGLRR